MPEESIFNDERVKVTTSRVIIDSKTYALRNITSVMSIETPANYGTGIGLLLLGILATAIDPTIAVGILVAGIIWLFKAKKTFHVAIASSGGEAHALSSKDLNYVNKVVQSINDAIIRLE